MNGEAALTLALAIVAEVGGTVALKASQGFTRPWPALGTMAGYGLAFYCVSLTMRTVPVGIIYAVWSGVGIVLISLSGWLVFGERLDAAALLGIGLIVAGVVVLQAASHSVGS